MQVCDSKAKAVAFESLCFCTAPLFGSEDSRTLKACQLFSLYRCLVFLLPVKNSNLWQINFKAADLLFTLGCLMSDNIHNAEKFIPKISLLMRFYHHFSFIMPVFVLHRACYFSIYIQSTIWNFSTFTWETKSFCGWASLPTDFLITAFQSMLITPEHIQAVLPRSHLHVNCYIFVLAQWLLTSFCLNIYLSPVTFGKSAWSPGTCATKC